MVRPKTVAVISAIGPSRPAAPPEPIVIADAAHLDRRHPESVRPLMAVERVDGGVGAVALRLRRETINKDSGEHAAQRRDRGTSHRP